MHFDPCSEFKERILDGFKYFPAKKTIKGLIHAHERVKKV